MNVGIARARVEVKSWYYLPSGLAHFVMLLVKIL